jgi:hypothetical protein
MIDEYDKDLFTRNAKRTLEQEGVFGLIRSCDWKERMLGEYAYLCGNIKRAERAYRNGVYTDDKVNEVFLAQIDAMKAYRDALEKRALLLDIDLFTIRAEHGKY